MTEYKPGDRVRTTTGETGTVPAIDPTSQWRYRGTLHTGGEAGYQPTALYRHPEAELTYLTMLWQNETDPATRDLIVKIGKAVTRDSKV